LNTSTVGAALLSRTELQGLLEHPRAQDRLIVTPLLEPAIQSGTLDLRLGTKFIVGRRTRQVSLNPLTVDEAASKRLQDLYELPFSSSFILHPNALVLACSLEYLSLPQSVAASVVTRSSYGRAGLVTATAIHVHPGFKGCLTFELLNLGQVPIHLYPGLRIAQLVFWRAHPEPEGHRVKYSLTTRPEFPKMWEEPEHEVLRRMGRIMGLDEDNA
jgi:deoxycytidine triphosphate deaminase